MKIKILLLITVVIFSFPKVHFGQVPNLGTSANFVLFTSAGAVSNVGITHLTGNVGSNSGLSTAFGNVDGQMHDNDGVSAQCATDLLIAYNQLNSAVPTFFPAPLLGNGQLLVAGVYAIASPATLNLDLILDGGGNPNAVFIFQIQGSFSTNANAKVKLINGAQACNVFWKVEGLISMATGTTMRGTLVANNAAIAMSTGDTLEGRALSTSGAITVSGTLGYIPIGCGSIVLTGPIAPNLASADCYELFSTNGPVTNVGVTNITGDIGTNNGSVTGFNPLFVVGAIHAIPDGSTAACATDLNNAFLYLNTLPYDIELLYPAQFGNNLVLTPHTYLMNSAVSFTDSLYFNAEGNVNAVFVIRVNGALSTSVNSRVKLINGAQAKNVYWLVNGAVTINNNSIFRGSIICNNGAINLNTGVILDGRALTTTGALNTAAITAILPLGSCGTGVSPSIITQPNSIAVCNGSSAVFTVSASGTALTYQWRKGLVNLIDGGSVSGATTATLTINPASLADTATNYNVVISGAILPSVTSINVSLTIDTPPTITTQATNQTACVGNSVSFTVVASGSNLTYQWRKGLVNLINGINISGATSATLIINPVALADTAYNYNVVISGTCLPDTISINVSLNISTAPTINIQPNNQNGCVGSSVSFVVVASGNNLTYQWRKGLVNLINGINISGATSATLIINPVALADTAFNYNVVVSGACLPNVISNYASLTIDTPPTITTQATNQTACVGSSVSFTTVASGSNLTYQWRKGLVNLINGATISGATSATLIINPIALIDTAFNYNVVISGACLPNLISNNASLTIDVPPTLTTQPTNQTACVGSAVSFTVAASGSNLTYQWRKGLVNLINGINISGATSATLIINPIALADTAFNYNVVVSGTCLPNAISNNVSLIINTAPVANATSNSPVCVSDSVKLNALSLIAGATYSWTSSTGFTSSLQNPIIPSATTSSAGTYSLTVTSGLCTSASATVAVVVNNCGTNLSIVKTVNATHPAVGSTVVFTIIASNNSLVNATGVTVTDVLQAGYAYVSSTSTSGTYSNLTSTWTIGNLNSNTTETLTITATVLLAGSHVNTATITGNEIDDDLTNNNSSIETFPTEFNIPEGLSPNGDGINDLFVIRGIQNYPNNNFTIFNRWGDKVFEASPYQNTWDGTCTKGLQIGGDVLPTGTYFYLLDLGDASKTIKGTIYLNRN